MSNVYTVTAEYFGTGEGVTHMVLFTRAYPSQDDYEIKPSFETDAEGTMIYKEGVLKYKPELIALKRFVKVFGSFYAQGADVKEGLHFDSMSAKLLISNELQEKLMNWNTDAGGFEYHTSLHLNFS